MNRLPLSIIVVLLTGTFSVLGAIYYLVVNNADLKAEVKSCNQRTSELETANKVCRDKLDVTTNLEGEMQSFTSSFEDFKRDWDYSLDYYIPSETKLLCPKEKGARNFQRMYYKQSIIPKGAELKLKFRMHDKNTNEYIQHFVIGIADGNNILSELDIPTRASDGQTMSLSGNALVNRPIGVALKSTIEEGSVINLSHELQSKVGQLVTQTTFLNYISKYGPEDDKFPTYDIRLEDGNPGNLPLRLFIGSYVGGCIEILDWSLIY